VTAFNVPGTGAGTVGTPLTITGVGDLTINADGSYSFAPVANYTGPIPVVTYTVSDPSGATDTSTLTLAITPVNDPPVDGNETNTVTEDTTLTVPAATGLLANATDVDGDTPLTVTAFTVPGTGAGTVGTPLTITGVGTLTIQSTGAYTFAPAANYTGPIPVVTYTVSDPSGATDTSTLTLTITPVNDAPVATDNVRTTPQDTTVGGNVITTNTGDGVDSDVDGDTLTVSAFTVGGSAGVVGAPTVIAGVGTLTLNGDGSYIFDPLPDFTGAVPAVVYTLSDGNGGTDTATLNITVEPLTETPSIVNDTATTPEDTPVTIDVLANDDPGSEGPLTITEINGQPISTTTPVTIADPVTGLPIGEVSLNDGGTAGDPTDDVLVFTPAPGYNGPVDFTYTVEDQNGNPLQGTVDVTVTPVNEPPVATDDSTVTPVDTPVTIDVLSNDSDPDGDPLTITEVDGTPITDGGAPVPVSNGTVTLVGGQLVFTPTPGYTGPATFDYTVEDPSGVPATASVTVNVGQANQPPVAQPDTNATDENTPLTVAAANGVIQSGTAPGGVDSDPNGDSLSVSAVNGVAGGVGQPVVGTYGTLVLNADGSYSYTPTAGAQALQAGQNVADVFAYTVTDPSGQTASTTLTITVTGVNDAPVAEDNSVVTPVNTPVSGNLLTDDGNGTAAGGVDSDPDGDPLTVSGFTVDGVPGTLGTPVVIPNVGSLTVNGNGVYTFAPVPGFEGAVPVVTYTISDGQGGSDTAALNILVDAVNDPPVALDDNVTGVEDQPVTFNPLTNDSDPEGQPLTITQVNGTPIVVGSPVQIDDPVTGDKVGDLVLNPNGTLTFTPVPNYNNTTPLPIQYTVQDPDGLTDTATINVRITPVNDAPVATDNVRTTPQDTTVGGNVITTNTGDGVDSDVDGDTLTVSAFTVGGSAGVVGAPTVIAGVGTLTLNGDGSYIFDPLPDFTGAVPAVVYTLSDGNGGTDTATLNITVEPLTETPSIVNDTATTPEDTPVTIDVLANDDPGSEGPLTITEINGQPISTTTPVTIADPVTGLPIGEVSLNDGGTAGDPTDDVLVFTPAPGYNGPVDFTYTVEDQNGNPLQGTVDVTVTPVNEPPVATDDSTVTPVDTPVTIDVLSNDSDPDGDPLTITEVDGTPITDGGAPVPVSNGTVTLVGGQLVFTPTPGYTGPATFDYTVEDPSGVPATASVTVNVGQANQPPVAQPDTNATDENTPLTVAAANGVIQSGTAPGGVDSDPNGDSLSVSAVNGVAGGVGQPVVGTYGTLVLNADGSYSYTPTAGAQALQAGQNVADVFAYTVTDPSGQTASTTLTITVTGVNDAPVAEDNSVVTPVNTPVSGNLLTDDGNGTAAGGVDSDPDGDPLTVSGFTVDGVPGTLGTPVVIPNVGSLTVNGNGVYTFAPVPGFEGAVPVVTYTISDGQGGSDTAALNILVDAVNDPPVALDDNVTGVEDQPVTFNPLTNDSDPEGQPLTITQVNGTPIVVGSPVQIDDPVTGDKVGDLVLNPNGTLTFTPVPNYNNTTPLPIQYTVQDPDGLTDTATINVRITPVNDAPVATDDGPVPTLPNSPVTGNVIGVNNGGGIDSDIDGDTLTVTNYSVDTDGDGIAELFAAGAPASLTAANGTPIGTLVIGANGAFSFTPAPDYAGTVPSATYTLSDGALTDMAVLSFGDVPEAPVEPYVPPPPPAPEPQPPAPPAPTPAPSPAPSPAPAPVPVDFTRPGAPPPVSEVSTVPGPVATTPALHVLYAVGETGGGSSFAGSNFVLDQASSPLLGEAAGRTPDALLFNQVDPYEDLRLIREPIPGEVIEMRHALHVQHAVRHQPVTAEHGLFVQHAVRSSQLDAQLTNASLNSQNSAAPGYSSLLDPFGLGSPKVAGLETKVVSDAVTEAPSNKVAEASAAKGEAVEPSSVSKAVVDAHAEQEVAKRPSTGFRAQLERFATDRKQSARPITRAAAVKS
jgi:large repetitive protein